MQAGLLKEEPGPDRCAFANHQAEVSALACAPSGNNWPRKLILVRIGECRIPDKMSSQQWLDDFQDGGHSRL